MKFMSVFKNIGDDLTNFIYDLVGEEKVHELGGEFLGVPYQPGTPFFDDIDVVVHGSDLFLAWLWSDCLYKKRSFLQHFYDKAENLSVSDKIEIGQMLASQQFSLFKFGEIKPGNIECIDLRTGVHYHVREDSLASQIRSGQVTLLRICQQGNHWEIIMPNGTIFPLTMDDEYLDQLVAKLPAKIGFKDLPAYAQLLSDIGIKTKSTVEEESISESVRLSKSDASKQLDAAHKNAGLDAYINLERLQEILEEEYKSKAMPLSPPLGVRIAMGLVNVHGSGDFVEVMTAAQDYWNSLIPDKVLRKRSKSREPSDIAVGLYNPTKWLEYAERAHDCIVIGDVEQAIERYNELFEVMHAEYSVTASLYRLVTNASTTYLVYGDLVLGSHLLDAAQRLCPSYDFAIKQRELLDSGFYQVVQNSAAIPQDNPIISYLAWFDGLGIDLTGGDGQATKLTKNVGTKIGRNDPCPCNALRENGLPKKYKHCHGQ